MASSGSVVPGADGQSVTSRVLCKNVDRLRHEANVAGTDITQRGINITRDSFSLGEVGGSLKPKL